MKKSPQWIADNTSGRTFQCCQQQEIHHAIQNPWSAKGNERLLSIAKTDAPQLHNLHKETFQVMRG